MTRATSTVENAVRVLNEALEADRAAVEQLFSVRTDANQALAEHPTIQVTKHKAAEFGEEPIRMRTTLGVLGLINGIFGVDERHWGYIASCHPVGDDYHILKFVVLDPAEPKEPT